MKTIVSISGLFILLSLFSCRKSVNFGLDYQESFTIPSTIGINSPLDIPTPEITTNSSSEFENNDTKASLVESVNLRSLKLTITDPSGKTFSFLNEIHIYINAEGLSQQKLAYKENIPSSVGGELDLEVTNENFADYLKTDAFSLDVTVVTDETIFSDVTIESDMEFGVSAKTTLF